MRQMEQQAVELSRTAGDPQRPLDIDLPAAQAYLDRDVAAFRAQSALLAEPLRTFITPAAPERLRREGCEIALETPAGVQRADGAFNGYRTLATCGAVVVDVLEFDYRQPLTQRVQVHLSAAAVNDSFGEGRATVRYYRSANGERTTAFQWYDDRQDVSLRAMGPESSLAAPERLRSVMSDIVEARRAEPEAIVATSPSR